MTSILCPLAPSNSTCGYCGPPGQRSATKSNCHAAELIPIRMTCDTYQKMIDRGWRRSGTFCYKPDNKRTCCPQYTIKLDALQFKPSKSQRKLVNRFNRDILHGEGGETAEKMNVDNGKGKAKTNGHTKPSKREAPFVLEVDIHASEASFLAGQEELAHRFEVTLEHSSYTEEKFALFQEYQREVHKENEKQPSGFKRFLVESPLRYEDIPYPRPPPDHLPKQYGSYHQVYRLDGKLVAMGVIDILPNCVSSVYFMYDKECSKYALGKLSAMREAALAKEIHQAGILDMKYLYMGYYIHSCPKMRYKGEYGPSYLADPEDYTWHPLDKCKPLLDKHRYACFSHPEHSIAGPYSGPPDEPDVPEEVLKQVRMLAMIPGQRSPVLIPPELSPEWRRTSVRQAIKATVSGLGTQLIEEVVLYLGYEI
ncbi:hypothetical protein K474DRAFT_1655378 [Panus rudis PR-1116 ss-1]|nr:hypothetical protein K474DRAFT_1655378 [Panus rudis PR-1116 ss-1]